LSTATDDFIRSSGNLAYINTWLKLIALVLLVLCLLLGGALLVKIIDGRKEHVVPIVINHATGDATPVDYRVIDAAGEERSPIEVRKFSEDFVTEAFTYNRYTIKTNLESIARWTAPEALTQVREALNLPRRAELISRNAQGLAELSSLLITETKPLLRVQAYFQAKALSPADEMIEEGKFLAVLVIKPVKRSTRNPHGLIVIEYRQSSFEKKSEGS
jgi:VirB8 protein